MANNVPLRNHARFHKRNLLKYFLLSICVGTFKIYEVGGIECGTVNLLREVILAGNEVVKGEWPFLAALYYARYCNYFCGGTIISNKHILTGND